MASSSSRLQADGVRRGMAAMTHKGAERLNHKLGNNRATGKEPIELTYQTAPGIKPLRRYVIVLS
eukprot:1812351-Amphidinium_carterae.1